MRFPKVLPPSTGHLPFSSCDRPYRDPRASSPKALSRPHRLHVLQSLVRNSTDGGDTFGSAVSPGPGDAGPPIVPGRRFGRVESDAVDVASENLDVVLPEGEEGAWFLPVTGM
jgi:hypothetical protein